ncbi:unnamed protein product [Pleuronectes platessa]|uniref:Uncharacterized protein n=1 Tax=Pleuronectes platessa TaxID=8262 RepID=A0A9N7VQ89_PLEPL|nr:unnamed protein product [Pleuronectes platessa]
MSASDCAFVCIVLQPSGCRAKWSVSEEGHPLGVVFGTNTAAAFPLLYPSVGFGPLLWTTAPIWPGFSKHALEQKTGEERKKRRGEREERKKRRCQERTKRGEERRGEEIREEERRKIGEEKERR